MSGYIVNQACRFWDGKAWADDLGHAVFATCDDCLRLARNIRRGGDDKLYIRDTNRGWLVVLADGSTSQVANPFGDL